MKGIITYILTFIIALILGVYIALVSSNIIIVNGSEGDYYAEYKNKVYKLVIPKTDKEFINE